LIIDAMHVVIVSPQCFNIFGPTPSKPVDFLISSFSMISMIFFTSNGVMYAISNS